MPHWDNYGRDKAMSRNYIETNAIPLDKVQAAIDEMVCHVKPLKDGTLTESGQVFDACADILEFHTGVTPSGAEAAQITHPHDTLSGMIEAFKKKSAKPFRGFIYQFTQGELDHLIELIRRDSVPLAKPQQMVDEISCPVCGYYCLGRGGIWCIDKPSMLTGITPSEVQP